MKKTFLLASLLAGEALGSGLPVNAVHPRILLTPTLKASLQLKRNANDPTWLAMKARADTLKTYTIHPYDWATRTDRPPSTIFYDYQGEGWFDAALPLALAFQMTNDTTFSGKLAELAQEMIRAQSAPGNNPPLGLPPLQPDNYYPTRNLGPVLAIIYDWCYDQLAAPLRAQMVTLMNAYFDDMRATAYEVDDYATGNFFVGHLIAAAYMGYASFGDNPRAQEMIDYARIRFDGTPSALVQNVPLAFFSQTFEGGIASGAKRDYLGPDVTGAPFASGFDFQAWSYGSETFIRIIDYLLTIKSATTEDVLTARLPWFSKVLRAQKHALFPNRFYIDPAGDWGGNYGATIVHALPLRLASILAGTADGPFAQSFYYSEIDRSATYPEGDTSFAFRPYDWESFVFEDSSRPSAAFVEPPYYSAFGPAYPAAGATNGAFPYFIMRSDFGPNATWASIQMGSNFYDDHQHMNAGHLEIARGSDKLLVDRASWMGDPGSSGVYGGCNEADNAISGNTLTIDDFGDYTFTTDYGRYGGGQGVWGVDKVVAAEQNLGFTYARADLSSAYNRAGDPADEVNRMLEWFYRSFLYLRPTNLFVVYDQVKMKTSANPRGPYRKQIRWHFSNVPTLAGNRVQVDHGPSRLHVTTLLPANATLTPVDESIDTDPCEPGDVGCVPYTDNAAGSWRVEVRDPANPLAVDFLTFLEPGPTSLQPATGATLTTSDAKMKGAVLTPRSGPVQVALFNAQAGAVPPPVTTTSYAFTGPLGAVHTLGGMVPGATYDATSSSGTVTVTQSGGGAFTASAAGVLQLAFLRYGDLDKTSAVDVFDIVILASYIVGNIQPGAAPFLAPRDAALLNGDALVDLFDLVLLQAFIVGNVTALPTS